MSGALGSDTELGIRRHSYGSWLVHFLALVCLITYIVLTMGQALF